MHVKNSVLPTLLISTVIIMGISACSESDAPESKEKTSMETVERAAPEQSAPEQSAPAPEQKKQPVAFENNVIYQEAIYKNWPYTETPQAEPESPVTGMSGQDAPIQQQIAPVILENNVIYQEAIYKDWPYTEAPQGATGPTPAEMIEKKVETVKAMAEEKIEAAAQIIEAPITPAAGAVTETPVSDTAASKTPASTASIDGRQVYNTYCAICHKAGLNAAPKYGSKPYWAKRIAQGRDTVYANSINGLRGMPPRGGFSNLSDEEVKAGVDYMVRAAGGWGDN